MKKANGIVRSAALTTSATLINGPSEKRVALLFSPPVVPNTFYTISTDPNVTLGVGINLLPSSGPVMISVETFGDAAVRPWYGIASTAMTIGYLEAVAT